MQRILNFLQQGLWGVAIFLALRGNAAHGVLVLSVLAVPLLRFLFFRSYRAAWNKKFQEDARLLLHPTLGRIPWRILFRRIFLPALALYLVNGRNLLLSSYDNFGTHMTAIALLETGSPNVGPYLEASRREGKLPYSFRTIGEGIYSSYPLGMVGFALPVFAGAKILGADLGKHQWRLAKLVAALVASASLVLAYLVLSVLVSGSVALWCMGFLAVASCVFTVVGQGLWTNGGVFFWEWVFLFLGLLSPFPLVPSLVLQGFALSQMVSNRLTAVLFIAPLLLFFARISWRKTLWVVGAFFLFLLPWGLFYQRVYGTPFGPQQSQGTGFAFTYSQFVSVFPALLFSPARGFFYLQPVGFASRVGSAFSMEIPIPRVEWGNPSESRFLVCLGFGSACGVAWSSVDFLVGLGGRLVLGAAPAH
jgi:hypothetical protein